MVSEYRIASATCAACFPRTLKLLVLLNSTIDAMTKERAIRACDRPMRCSVVGDHDLLSRMGRITRSHSGTSTRMVPVAKIETEAGGISKLPILRCIDSACCTMIVASWAYPKFQTSSVTQIGMIRKSCFVSSTWLTGTKSVGAGSPKRGQETPGGTTAARSSQRIDSVWASGGGGPQSSRRCASSSPPPPKASPLSSLLLLPTLRRNEAPPLEMLLMPQSFWFRSHSSRSASYRSRGSSGSSALRFLMARASTLKTRLSGGPPGGYLRYPFFFFFFFK